MSSKYEVLAALIDATADQFGDEMGWHHTINGVLRDLHDWQSGRIPDDELAEAIYERIANSTSVPSFDEAEQNTLQPGEVNPDTGLYRVE